MVSGSGVDMTRLLRATKSLVKQAEPISSESGESATVPDPRLKEIAARAIEAHARVDAQVRAEERAKGEKPKGFSWRDHSDRGKLSDSGALLAVRALESGRTITLSTLLGLADGAGVSPGWLVSGEGPGGRFRDLPGWTEIERETRTRYPDVPDFAVRHVGSFSLPYPPDRLTPDAVRDFARAWFDASSDELRQRVENAYVREKRKK
jgi:hypothetical protein